MSERQSYTNPGGCSAGLLLLAAATLICEISTFPLGRGMTSEVHTRARYLDVLFEIRDAIDNVEACCASIVVVFDADPIAGGLGLQTRL
ncbi:uncharacterized protein B0I36DRAFT_327777 [Microdochium trichocladiopsis]|uniref:Uncharacterized protein n=1 Tax=Microdochium trichocladiopsis TaxID=1682393 RepID=A0A9P8Y2K5_9PEZI|nr:uncharacterized protein B0I36DRAFT_327777 [Microdochium trichocladiopsis]KAH7027738.1 hypothetical protein B0I36DRAFT_327777 [Microdochium trichocladiopsis]